MPNRQPASIPQLNFRILLVDDGSINRQIIQSMLQRAGAVVICAENGSTAIDIAAREPFDLILMDIHMPIMDGYTATAKLREIGVRTPIVALTANTLDEDMERCREAGCSGYLSKLDDPNRLVESIAGILESRTRSFL